MGNYQSPGVYVEEVELGAKPIEGVATNVAGTVGVTVRGPENVPVLVTSFTAYVRQFGGYRQDSFLTYAARSFFDNGGRQLYIVRVASVNLPARNV